MNKYENLVGNALAGYGPYWGGPGAAVFGQEAVHPAVAAAAAQQAAMAPPAAVAPVAPAMIHPAAAAHPLGPLGMVPAGFHPGGFPGYPLDGNCWGPPAVIDPRFHQRNLFSAVLGTQCGPLLQQQPLPFEDVGCIKDCEEVDIRAFPQLVGKLVRIILPDPQADSFLVTGIFIGIQPIFAGQGVFPGGAFKPDSENVLMSTYSFFQNQPVTIRVRNVSGAPAFCNPGAIVMAVTGGTPQLYGTPLGGC